MKKISQKVLVKKMSNNDLKNVKGGKKSNSDYDKNKETTVVGVSGSW